MESFPIQTVVAWLGNSPNVALQSYLQVRESDFEKAVQNPVQYTAVYTRLGSQTEKTENDVSHCESEGCEEMRESAKELNRAGRTRTCNQQIMSLLL